MDIENVIRMTYAKEKRDDGESSLFSEFGKKTGLIG
jgi:hypothetical protein